MSISYDKVQQSGSEQQFDTGSVRDSREGKGRFDLISPVFLTRLAQHTENGAKRYGDRNWEKGQPLSRFMDSAMRHLFKYQEGHRDEDHLAAAAWNIQGIIHTEEMVRRGKLPASLIDWPNYVAEWDERERPEEIVDVPQPPRTPQGYLWTGAYREPMHGEYVTWGDCVMAVEWKGSPLKYYEDGPNYWILRQIDA